jgi:L-lactate dehydrogenase complex protein LldE
VRVALFLACFNDMLFPGVGESVVRLLSRLGHEVAFPQRQTCCGQMHFNTGYRDECVPLVRDFAATFEPYDVVVTPSASCAAMVRMHHATVAAHADDHRLAGSVAAVAPRVYELTEFLIDIAGVTDVGATFPYRVAFHPTCHSTRLLGIGDRPLRLLAAVDGLELVPLSDADQCCGFGGTFAIKNPDVSVAMGINKLVAIEATGAEVLTAADTSCLIHLGGLLARRSSPIRVMHLAEILAPGRDA